MKARIKQDKQKFNKSDIVLSIGMIVKNEQKYLKQCLDALQPLLRAVPSELIIVDTGSVDDTVSIAKQYTDKVYSFEWDGNFANARNASLKRAVGEWFMFVDADEVFENTDELQDFLQKGRTTDYHGYNLICYPMVNLSEKEGDVGLIHLATRGFRRFEGIKFQYRVHESVNVEGGKAFSAQSVQCKHYGYSKNLSSEYREEKLLRNLEQLKLGMQEEPDEPHYYTFYVKQIGEEWEKYGDELVQMCREALKKFPDRHNQTSFSTQLILYYTRTLNYTAALEVADKVLDKEKPNFTDIDILFYMGTLAASTKRYKQCREHFLTFIERQKQYGDGRLNSADMLHSVQIYKETWCVQEAYAALLMCSTQLGDSESAVQYLSSIDYSVFFSGASHKSRINFYTYFRQSCDRSSDYIPLVQLLTHIPFEFETEIAPIFNDICAGAQRDNLFNAVTGVIKNSDTVLQALLLTMAGGDVSALFDHDAQTLAPFAAHVVVLCCKAGISPDKIATLVTDCYCIEDTIVKYLRNINGTADILFDYFSGGANITTAKGLMLCCTLQSALCNENIIDSKRRHTAFGWYIDGMWTILTSLYNAEVLDDENIELLPPAHRFVYFMHRANEAKLSGDTLNQVRKLRSALKVGTSMSGIIEHELSLLEQSISGGETQTVQTAENHEFEMLGQQMLIKIKDMIKAGDTATARELLLQLKAIMPDNIEVYRLLKQIDG